MRPDAPPFEPRGAGDPRRVRALVDLGRIREALVEVRRILARDPRHPAALELLGLCLIRNDQPAEALAPLRDAVAQQPRRAHVHYLIGFAAGLVGDAAGAERGLAEAVRIEPDEPVYLRALAEHYADRRRIVEALPLARRAIAVDPDRSSNHRTLGYVSSAAGELEQARSAYERAIGLDPQDAVAWNNLGCVLLSSGLQLEARERFREALRLDPGGERARRNLALVARTGRPRLVYRDFDAFLGEAIRELHDAGRLPPSVRTVALALAVGRPALSRAFTGRLESRGPRGRVAAAAGTVVVAAVARRLRPASLPAMGLLALVTGAGYLAAARRMTPLRRRFVERIQQARREWESTRQAWLDGKLSRPAREAAVDRQLERLALDLDGEGDPGDPVTPTPAGPR